MNRDKATDKRNSLTFSVLFFFFLVFFLALSFRKIRDFLPPPEIRKEHIVGYAQYFGYPLYLDVAVFFIVILCPVIIFLLIKLWKSMRSKTYGK